MKAEDLMVRDVRKCSKDDSLEQAARIMWETDVGCLVVTDSEDRPTCAPNSSVGDVEVVMRSARIRRIPVVKSNGKLAGIVTLGDIARSSQSSPLRAAEIPGVAKTLAVVTEPRSLAAAAQ
jgi:CBS domain-containing protein